MKSLLRWLDERTGLPSLLGAFLDRPLAGAPSPRYVLPSVLGFAFLVEALTGIVLWMYYSPGAQTAWESVFWIQEGLRCGWLLRGIHFYAGHMMVVLALLYVAQLVLLRTYRAPREFTFWIALALVGTLLGLLLTGDLLRWDQEGYWSTQVRTSFCMLLPKIGGEIYKVAIGGPAFGHLTVTRFFALHAGLLSAVLVGILVCNWWLLGRQGLKNVSPEAKPGRSWPCQAALNTLGWVIFIGVVTWLVARPALDGPHPGQVRGQYMGAPLGAPADPAEAYAAARPEWAFLALYEFSNLFPGELKILPIFIIPGAIALVVVLMPFIGRWGIGHAFNLLFLGGLTAGAVYLSLWGMREDAKNAIHQAALKAGHEQEVRARLLAKAPQGIPVSGALTLVRSDAKIQGPKLFQQHCASCHAWVDPTGAGIKPEKQTAPNLYHYASRAWLGGLLDPKRITSAEYFGGTALRKGEMPGFVKDTFSDLEGKEKEQREAAITAVSADAGLKSQRALDARDAALIAKGRAAVDDYNCANCHKLGSKGKFGNAPDLTGFGTREWLVGIISNPAHKRFYGKRNDRMPLYAEFPESPEKNVLNAQSIALLADWLRGEWYEPAAK